MVGIGSGASAVGMAAAVANRWFARRNGLAMGLLTAPMRRGSSSSCPFSAMLAERYGWRGVSVTVTLVIAAAVPVVALLLPKSPADVGLGPFGTRCARALPRHLGNPFAAAVGALSRASHSMDFWLLTASFAVCGLSTNGLINTHLIAYCADRGSPRSQATTCSAALGVFSLIGATASGWMCDHFNPRILLFWITGCAAVIDRDPVHPVRHGQPVDLLGFLWSRLGRHRPRHFRLGQ